MSIDTSSAYSIITGINIPNRSTDKKIDTMFVDFADQKAQENEENKTGTTLLLEDFAGYADCFHGDNRMNINSEDVKKGFKNSAICFFGLREKNTLYYTDEAREYIEDNGSIYLNNIYEMSNSKYAGVKYAFNGEDIYESALNFSNAAIEAVEKTYSKVADSNSKQDNKLTIGELAHISDLDDDALSQMDLDGDPESLSAEEYASYLIAADGLVENPYALYGAQYSKYQMDGLISQENSKLAKGLSDEEFKKYAQSIYDEYFKQD